MSRQPPVQQPPPVLKVRLRYSKAGTARFASHRDFARAFERALRRAEVPMALSSGFNPHPRISYLNAAPTGAASFAEYAEIGLAERIELEWLQQALNSSLPGGFQILAAIEADQSSFAETLTHSLWVISAKIPTPVLAKAITAFLAAASVTVQRMGKAGIKEFEIRQAVVSLERSGDLIEAVIALGSPLVRPDDIVAGLVSLVPESKPELPALFTRLAQGHLVDGKVIDPFGDVQG